jgi:myosin-15
LEQEEYNKERIKWDLIDYTDNKPCLDLIAKKPNGIIYLLDDESHFPKSTDTSLVEKMNFIHGTNPFYSKPRMLSSEFSIKHFAGEVIYEVKNFLDKNRDLLRLDVFEVFINSQNYVNNKLLF